MSKSLQQVLIDSKQINSGFSNQWDIKTRMINLSEEVGELSHDVLVAENEKSDKPIAKNMGLNLTNLLYELMLISDHYNVNLDESWDEFVKAMPQWVEMRNK